jgi:putative membrane protein
MKTPFKMYIAGAAIWAVSAFYACSNTNSNNASYAADSANKAQITKSDSLNNEIVAQKDSANKELLAKGDSVNKVIKELKEDASKFLVKSYELNLFEIELSQLAATHAASVEVKKFASQVISAHKDINFKMVKIAFDANYKLPGGIDDAHVKDVAKLDKLKGSDFDKKYMDLIVSGHEKAVDSYQDAYKDLSVGETKAFAGKSLPLIQDHLATAKKLKDKLD